MKKTLFLISAFTLVAIAFTAFAPAGHASAATSSGCAAVNGYNAALAGGVSTFGPYALAAGETVVVSVSNLVGGPGTVAIVANVSGVGPVGGNVVAAPGDVVVVIPFDLTVTFEVTAALTSVDISVTCTGVADAPTPASDGRLDTGVANLEVAIYPLLTEPGLVFYGIDADGNGYPVFTITEDDVAGYETNPPAVNTLIKESADGYYQLWVLTTGELQLNIGPDAEGKTRVIIFDDIRPDTIYGYIIE